MINFTRENPMFCSSDTFYLVDSSTVQELKDSGRDINLCVGVTVTVLTDR